MAWEKSRPWHRTAPRCGSPSGGRCISRSTRPRTCSRTMWACGWRPPTMAGATAPTWTRTPPAGSGRPSWPVLVSSRTWSLGRPTAVSSSTSSWEPAWTPLPNAGRSWPPAYGSSRSTGPARRPGSAAAWWNSATASPTGCVWCRWTSRLAGPGGSSWPRPVSIPAGRPSSSPPASPCTSRKTPPRPPCVRSPVKRRGPPTGHHLTPRHRHQDALLARPSRVPGSPAQQGERTGRSAGSGGQLTCRVRDAVCSRPAVWNWRNSRQFPDWANSAWKVRAGPP